MQTSYKYSTDEIILLGDYPQWTSSFSWVATEDIHPYIPDLWTTILSPTPAERSGMNVYALILFNFGLEMIVWPTTKTQTFLKLVSVHFQPFLLSALVMAKYVSRSVERSDPDWNISNKLFNGLPWNFVQTWMMSKPTNFISWCVPWFHHDGDILVFCIISWQISARVPW